MTTLTQITVPFHNAELYLVEHDGQPYTPMKPIVEGMGMDWASQFVKLKQRFASTIVEITIVANDGKERLMTCLPVRKLFGWLMTISPNKVKPEIRDTVIMYQQECDDVLWDYWTKGQAINKRLTITPEQQHALHEIVDRRAGKNRSQRASMWVRHNRHFGIAKYSQLLSIHFEEAKQYLESI
ncbi:antirepressor N-terminal domain protein, partial [Acinetobacter baumannii UH12208]